MVGDDEATRMVPGPVRRVQGRGDRSLPPTGEGGGRRYARERVCDENEAYGGEGRRSHRSTDRRPQVQETEEADPGENREWHNEVLHMSIRDEDPRSDGNPHDRGTEKAEEPRIRGQALRGNVEELPARPREGNDEEERGEMEEAIW